MIEEIKVLFHYKLGKYSCYPELPITHRNDIGEHHSSTKLVYCVDGTVWLAFWDSDDRVWRNANYPDKMYLNKLYVVGWMDVPLRTDIKGWQENSL